MRWFGIVAFVFVAFLAGFGQCPVSDFSLQSEACLNEEIRLDQNALNSSLYEWVFCTTDYTSAPSATKLLSNYGAVYYSKILKNGDDTYLFCVSQTLNKLIGLRFTDLTTLSYVVHCEIDLSGIITNPAGLDIINDNGAWIGLVSSIVAPFKLVKIVFDENIQIVEESIDLSSVATLATPFDVRFLQQENDFYAFIANSTAPVAQQVIRLSFGASLSNLPVVSYVGFPASSQIASLDFHYSCNEWTGFASSRNGKIFRMDFAADLNTETPGVTDLTLSNTINDPGGFSLVEEHDEWIFIVQSRNGNLYTGRIESIADNTVDITNYGNVKSSTRDWGIEVYRFEEKYRIISGNFTNGGFGGLYALDFTQLCPGDKKYSKNPFEIFSFVQQGAFKISLKASNAAGASDLVTKEILVSNLQAPQISIQHPPAFCVASPVGFALDSDLELSSQDWDFGDGAGVSSDSAPEYSYGNSGDVFVTVGATAINGCKNIAESSLIIFDPPQSGFTLPPNLLCTNNSFTFHNTTPDTYNGHLSYQWFVDDNPASNELDLQHTFTTTGPKEIKLVTSIPGCADETSQTTSPVESGPVVDFSFSGTCEQETFLFQNEISEPVLSYLWDFGNGNTTDEANPSQEFTAFGDYIVSLMATNAAGCENIQAHIVAVHANPLIDFSADGPPNACAGTSASLQNQTANPDGREITEWLWDFSDPGNPEPQREKEPDHTFEAAGVYPVSLTATTASGCESTEEREITIMESPSVAFAFTPPCEDVPVTFSGPSGSGIAGWYWEIGTSYYDGMSPTHSFQTHGDYPLYLAVTGTNGCVSTHSQNVHIPEPLSPDFSVLKNCVDHETVFTDITTGIDPVIAREWILNGTESFFDSPLTQTFPDPGTENITLKVTAQSGCSYTRDRLVEIFPAPVAAFYASPASGAYPLEVNFTNTSSDATTYRWQFMDGTGTTSAAISPVHTFNESGSYNVVLTAYDERDCEDSFSAIVSTVAPLPDADVDMITLTPNADGSLKLIVTIYNKGNTILRNLPLDINFSGSVALRQVITESILPGTKHNFVLSTGILDAERQRYLCVSIDLDNDLSPMGNRMCTEFKDQLFVFSSYPNPTHSILNLEWISRAETTIRISLADALGRNIWTDESVGSVGLNHRTMDLSGLQNGIYYLFIEDGLTKSRQRILVSGKP